MDFKPQDDAVQDLSGSVISFNDITSTYIDRPSIRNNMVSSTVGAYENVPCDFGEKSNRYGGDSVDDIDIKVGDESKEAHYSPLTTYENIPRNTNENILVNEYEMLKK